VVASGFFKKKTEETNEQGGKKRKKITDSGEKQNQGKKGRERQGDWKQRGRKNRRGRKKTEEIKPGISFNHLFTIFNNSSASRNPDRRRTPVDLTREDAEL